MNRNHIDDRWRQCHWEEWREIKNRWNQVRKTEEPNRQSERIWAAETSKARPGLSFKWNGCNSTTLGSWSGSHSFSPVFPAEVGVSPRPGFLAHVDT